MLLGPGMRCGDDPAYPHPQEKKDEEKAENNNS